MKKRERPLVSWNEMGTTRRKVPQTSGPVLRCRTRVCLELTIGRLAAIAENAEDAKVAEDSIQEMRRVRAAHAASCQQCIAYDAELAARSDAA